MMTEKTTFSPETISNTNLLDIACEMGPMLNQHVDEERNNRRPSPLVQV